MKSLVYKDQKLRLKYFKNENLKVSLKFLSINPKNSLKSRSFFSIKLEKVSKSCSLTKIKNRCLSSNRGKGIIKKLGLSRIKAKEFFTLGLIPGFNKSVW